jgi:hypothetical protein
MIYLRKKQEVEILTHAIPLSLTYDLHSVARHAVFPVSCAGIFKQFMGARNRVRIVLLYRPTAGYTALHYWFLGIDSWAP